MKRDEYLHKIKQAFEVNPAVALLGPRQCGKTTLAKTYAQSFKNILFLDLENPVHLAKLESPMLALDKEYDLIVIDEIQRRPELFLILRVLIDQKERRQKFLLLGSASRELIRQSSETLAGRISYLELTPFCLFETGEMKKLWLRGGFPQSFLAKNDRVSLAWRDSYITTFLEQDIPSLGFHVPPMQIRRFFMMLAHCHGNILNVSELGVSLGVSHTAINNYLSILTGTFMIRQLLPWFENIHKRQIKSPKIFFRDSGIFHALLKISSEEDLYFHPKLGASWEGFAIEEVIKKLGLPPEQCFFWGVHAQAELDLLVFINNKKIGFEIKYNEAPTMSKSMHLAMELLKLDELNIIYPGKTNYLLRDNIKVCSLEEF